MARKARDEPTLNVLMRQSLLDGESEIAAFKRIAKLAKSMGKVRSNSAPVEVSAWIVSVLAQGWERYEAADGSLTLGQAFQLEGNRSGGHKSLGRINRLEKYWDMAVAVERLMQDGHSKSAAIAIVASDNGKTADQLRKALDSPSLEELEALAKRKAAKDR